MSLDASTIVAVLAVALTTLLLLVALRRGKRARGTLHGELTEMNPNELLELLASLAMIVKTGGVTTMWCALDAVDEENGSLSYLPASHAAGLRDTLGASHGSWHSARLLSVDATARSSRSS